MPSSPKAAGPNLCTFPGGQRGVGPLPAPLRCSLALSPGAKPGEEPSGDSPKAENESQPLHGSGICKWFNVRMGFGFLSMTAKGGAMLDSPVDVFVHQVCCSGFGVGGGGVQPQYAALQISMLPAQWGPLLLPSQIGVLGVMGYPMYGRGEQCSPWIALQGATP